MIKVDTSTLIYGVNDNTLRNWMCLIGSIPLILLIGVFTTEIMVMDHIIIYAITVYGTIWLVANILFFIGNIKKYVKGYESKRSSKLYPFFASKREKEVHDVKKYVCKYDSDINRFIMIAFILVFILSVLWVVSSLFIVLWYLIYGLRQKALSKHKMQATLEGEVDIDGNPNKTISDLL